MRELPVIYADIIRKEKAVAARNRGKIPYTATGHVFNDQSGDRGISWWTNGFWGGIMWQLYAATGECIFAENARFTEESLDRVFLDHNGMDHDAGFRWLPTAVASYRIEKNEASKNRGLLAADSLAGRFNINARLIRAWNDWGDGRNTTGLAIIDCMMNLPLLYWASEVTGDPRYFSIAKEHAENAARYFVRNDGSVRHIVEFDPVAGGYVREHGGQGMEEGSSWTRGQAWAIYGFALSYQYTKEELFVNLLGHK